MTGKWLEMGSTWEVVSFLLLIIKVEFQDPTVACWWVEIGKRSRDHTGRWTSELIWAPVWQPLHPQPEFDLCLWLSHASRIHHHPDPWWMVSWSSIMLGLTVFDVFWLWWAGGYRYFMLNFFGTFMLYALWPTTERTLTCPPTEVKLCPELCSPSVSITYRYLSPISLLPSDFSVGPWGFW